MKGKKNNYTQEQLEYIKKNKELPAKQLTEQLNKKFNTNYTECAIKGVKLRNGWKTGRTGRFEKGNKPIHTFNKGHIPKNAFKNGHKPHNWRQVGSSRLTKDGYLEIKIGEPRTWKLLHIILYENYNGQIPKGHCIIFKDGDRTNIKIDNLQLIKRSENLKYNRLSSDLKTNETRDTVRNLAKLLTAIDGKRL